MKAILSLLPLSAMLCFLTVHPAYGCREFFEKNPIVVTSKGSRLSWIDAFVAVSHKFRRRDGVYYVFLSTEELVTQKPDNEPKVETNSKRFAEQNFLLRRFAGKKNVSKTIRFDTGGYRTESYTAEVGETLFTWDSFAGRWREKAQASAATRFSNGALWIQQGENGPSFHSTKALDNLKLEQGLLGFNHVVEVLEANPHKYGANSVYAQSSEHRYVYAPGFGLVQFKLNSKSSIQDGAFAFEQTRVVTTSLMEVRSDLPAEFVEP